MDFGAIAVKLAVGFIGLWAATRILGKKEISQLTPFDFISALIMSEIIGNAIYERKYTILHVLFALVFWTLLSYIFEKLTQHVKRARVPLDGAPDLIVKEGRIDYEKLRRNKLDADQLRMMLRQKDVFSVRDVAYAWFELNGSLSVLKKPAYDTAQKQDLGHSEEHVQLPHLLIEEGSINDDNIRGIGKTKEWLREELSRNGHPDPSRVLYAEWTEDGELHVAAIRTSDD